MCFFTKKCSVIIIILFICFYRCFVGMYVSASFGCSTCTGKRGIMINTYVYLRSKPQNAYMFAASLNACLLSVHKSTHEHSLYTSTYSFHIHSLNLYTHVNLCTCILYIHDYVHSHVCLPSIYLLTLPVYAYSLHDPYTLHVHS